MGIVLLVAVTLAVVGFSELLTSKSSGEAKEAFYIAEFGMQDALIRVTRGVTSSLEYYQPDVATYPDLNVGINPIGIIDNGSTVCNELGSFLSCTTCAELDNTTQVICEARSGCSWSVGLLTCTGTPTLTTYLVCSDAIILKDTSARKQVTLQAIIDINPFGMVRQCSWEQL